MSGNILLTGRPGCGKTTAIQRTLELLDGLQVGGFYTEEIREAGARVGFGIVGLHIGAGVLAHVNCSSRFRVSKYGVNVDDLERIGVAALRHAQHHADLILADEIGRMEMCSPLFCESVTACLDAPAPVLGTLQDRRDPFLDEVRARSDVLLITVARDNRDDLPTQLAERLRASIRGVLV